MAWVWSLVRELLLGRKAMTNLDCIQRQRYHFVDKGPYSQSYGFSCNHVWMWELDHKEESMFLIVVLEKVSFWPSGQRVSWTRGSSWTRRRSIQSILKEINPEYSLEGLMLELKLQYLDRLMQKRQLNGNDPDVWKDWRAGGEGVTEDKMVDGITSSMDISLCKLWKTVKDSEAWHAAVHGIATSQRRLSHWTRSKRELGSLKLRGRAKKKKGIWRLSQIPVLHIAMLHKLMYVLHFQCSKTI